MRLPSMLYSRTSVPSKAKCDTSVRELTGRNRLLSCVVGTENFTPAYRIVGRRATTHNDVPRPLALSKGIDGKHSLADH